MLPLLSTCCLFFLILSQEGDPTLTDRVWDSLVKSFASQMKSVFTASSFVKEIFTVGYPKLLPMIENLLERISRDTDVKGVPPALTLEGNEQMVAAVENFETAFLGLCLSRLSDLVNSVFPMSSRGTVPSKEHISRIISRIQEEIEAVHSDAHLTLRVLREISKVLLLLAERAEYQVASNLTLQIPPVLRLILSIPIGAEFKYITRITMKVVLTNVKKSDAASHNRSVGSLYIYKVP